MALEDFPIIEAETADGRKQMRIFNWLQMSVMVLIDPVDPEGAKSYTTVHINYPHDAGGIYLLAKMFETLRRGIEHEMVELASKSKKHGVIEDFNRGVEHAQKNTKGGPVERKRPTKKAPNAG